MKEKKAIVVVSFGTTYPDTRKKTIDACENLIREHFEEYEIRRAFTSHFIRKKLKERDSLQIDDVEQALHRLLDEGIKHVVIQPLHIMAGEEFYKKIIRVVYRLKDRFDSLRVGRPLLYTVDDYRKAIKALKSQLPEITGEKAVLLMGHGTHHHANACYSCLQLMLYREIPGVYVGTVGGYPLLDDVLPVLQDQGIKTLILMPYMLVAGDHALNDMGGDGEHSWKTRLRNAGFDVNVYLKGLGENPDYRALYVDHIHDAINGHHLIDIND